MSLFANPALVEPSTVARLTPERDPRMLGLRELVRAVRHQRRLLAWNRIQPRPAVFRNVPERVWRRHSALLTLTAGQDRARCAGADA